ncbi:MAG: hypothetical protein GY830_11165 [Bacteroidetes bacterium]|nr:hypothetical protein [Bacteroidota bacterium]
MASKKYIKFIFIFSILMVSNSCGRKNDLNKDRDRNESVQNPPSQLSNNPINKNGNKNKQFQNKNNSSLINNQKNFNISSTIPQTQDSNKKNGIANLAETDLCFFSTLII